MSVKQQTLQEQDAILSNNAITYQQRVIQQQNMANQNNSINYQQGYWGGSLVQPNPYYQTTMTDGTGTVTIPNNNNIGGTINYGGSTIWNSYNLDPKILEEYKKEILSFEPLTQQILEEIKDSLNNGITIISIEERQLKVGRIINGLVKNSNFKNKLDNIIEED